MSTIYSAFQVQLIISNFFSTLIVHQFFTWIALGDLELHFSPMLVRKAKLLKIKLHELRADIINVTNPHW
jgi:hypothetical protein